MYFSCLYAHTQTNMHAQTKTVASQQKSPLCYYFDFWCLFSTRIHCLLCIYLLPDFISSWKLKMWLIYWWLSKECNMSWINPENKYIQSFCKFYIKIVIQIVIQKIVTVNCGDIFFWPALCWSYVWILNWIATDYETFVYKFQFICFHVEFQTLGNRPVRDFLKQLFLNLRDICVMFLWMCNASDSTPSLAILNIRFRSLLLQVKPSFFLELLILFSHDTSVFTAMKVSHVSPSLFFFRQNSPALILIFFFNFPSRAVFSLVILVALLLSFST